MKRIILAFIAAGLFQNAAIARAADSVSAPPRAAAPIALAGEIKVRKQVVDHGVEREVLVEPQVVIPGDKLVFRTTYRNTSAEIVRDFVITNRLPAGVALSPDAAQSALVSVDGGKSWGKLDVLEVNDGAGNKRPALASDVTHLRWVLPEIKPGGSGEVTYDASVQ